MYRQSSHDDSSPVPRTDVAATLPRRTAEAPSQRTSSAADPASGLPTARVCSSRASDTSSAYSGSDAMPSSLEDPDVDNLLLIGSLDSDNDESLYSESQIVSYTCRVL